MLSATGFAIGNKLSYADAAIAYIAWFLRGRWDGGATLLAPFSHICALEEMLVGRGDGNATEMTAEAALAQCVREYAKERAQKVRLQQQIGALQKRLLKTQIDELQGKVIIGGRPLDEAEAAAAATPGGGPSGGGVGGSGGS